MKEYRLAEIDWNNIHTIDVDKAYKDISALVNSHLSKASNGNEHYTETEFRLIRDIMLLLHQYKSSKKLLSTFIYDLWNIVTAHSDSWLSYEICYWKYSLLIKQQQQ